VTRTNGIDKYRVTHYVEGHRTQVSFVRPNCPVAVIKSRALGVSLSVFFNLFSENVISLPMMGRVNNGRTCRENDKASLVERHLICALRSSSLLPDIFPSRFPRTAGITPARSTFARENESI